MIPPPNFFIFELLYHDIQIGTFDYTQLGFQFLDFQLKSFVDPKPVELYDKIGSICTLRQIMIGPLGFSVFGLST